MHYTARNGRYAGKGDDLAKIVAGEHSPAFHFLPESLLGRIENYVGFHENAHYGGSTQYTERKTGTGAAIAMAAGGLQLTTGSSASTDDAQFQAIRGWTVAAGKHALAFARLQIDDVTKPGFVFGFSTTDTDWFNAEGSHSAVVTMAKGGATVAGGSKDGTTGSSTSTLVTMVAATDVEFVIHVDGTSGIDFYHRTPGGAWSVTRKTSNPPGSGQVLRLICEVEAGESAAHVLTLANWGFYGEI